LPSNRWGKPLTHGALYHRILRKHAKAAGINGKSSGPHALRATPATNALDRGADLGKVQE
jgi:site-specific recombinase XerD